MTDDALRKRAWLWLNSTPLNRDQKMVAIDSLVAILATERADAVAECQKIVKASRGCPPIPKDNMLCAMKYVAAIGGDARHE